MVDRRDWVAWHRVYDDPESRLSHRLAMVQRHLRGAFDRAPAGTIRVISVCAGQGHDLFGVLADHPRRTDVVATLVELDPQNAEIARSAARELGLDGITVVEADAGNSDAYAGGVPASLIVLSGFFAYLDDADAGRLIAALPQLCAANAAVIWARGPARFTHAAQIRAWFRAAQFVELAAEDVEEPEMHVGVEQFVGDPVPLQRGYRLFTFRDPAGLRSTRGFRRWRAIAGRVRRRVTRRPSGRPRRGDGGRPV
jgi:hypothetical protein